jgi:hypothetical protein
MVEVDVPSTRGLPIFTDRLAKALTRAIDAPRLGDPAVTRPGSLDGLTWRAVFRRIESIWCSLLDSKCPRVRPGRR